MRLEFFVQGSSPEPYQVAFERVGDRLTARCSCPAGQVAQACKHRLTLLAGDASAAVDARPQDLLRLAEGLRGTALERALHALAEAEAEAAAAKLKAVSVKRMASRVMESGG